MRLPRSARTSLVTAAALVPALLLGSPAYAVEDATYSTPLGFNTLTVSKDATDTVTITNNSLTAVQFVGIGTVELLRPAAIGQTVSFTMAQNIGVIAAVGAGAEAVLVVL